MGHADESESTSRSSKRPASSELTRVGASNARAEIKENMIVERKEITWGTRLLGLRQQK